MTELALQELPKTRIIPRFIENFIIVWLDVQGISSDENYIVQLQQMVNSVNIFSTIEQCMDYCCQIQDEYIFMIISNLFNHKLYSSLSGIPQLNSIYLLTNKQIDHAQYKKVKGSFNDIELIFNEMKRDLFLCQRNITPISIINTNTTIDISELDESFICAQLIKDVFSHAAYDDTAKQELVEFCRVQYADNQHQLKIIDEFERDYNDRSTIWWYTRDCFTYSMFNRALRLQDMEIVIKMGFFICDLHKQIEKIYSKKGKPHALTAYRGQGILNSELEKLVKNKDGILSFNNFFSANMDRQLALNFAKQSLNNSDFISVLFHININPLVASSPYASLDKTSYFSHHKQGILFPMHTLFRINEIKQIENNLWQISLTMINDNDEKLVRINEYIRQTVTGETGMHRIAQLMLTMGKLDKAKDIYSALLETSKHDDKKERAYLHHQLAHVYEQKNQLSNALYHYDESLNLYLTYLPFNDPKLCPTYSNIGLILKKQGNHNNALEFLQHALDIDLIAPNPDRIEIATLYINIGGVYDAQGQSSEALENYENALHMMCEHLPPCHPLIAATHNSIGLVYYSMKDHANALKHFKKTLDIEEKSLPQDHPSLIMTHTNIAGVLEDVHQYKEAIEHAETAVDLLRSALGTDNSKVIILQEFLEQLRQKQ